MASFLKRKLNLDDLCYLEQEAKDYACSNGLLMRTGEGLDDVTFLPFCLFPYPFPEEWFNKAKSVQKYLNLLLHRISRDAEFLKRSLANACEADPFMQKLMEIHESVLKEGYAQSLSLGIFRMDYLLDKDDESMCLKQVEMNTIAASSGANANAVHSLQKHILKIVEAPDITYPEPKTISELAGGLANAWRAYGEDKAIIVFLVHHNEENFCDQRRLEYGIYKVEPRAKVLRLTFEMLHNRGLLRDRKLFVDDQEVSVVYFRDGYVPEQYPGEKEWTVRLMLERSQAILCPNIPLQLTGSKKIQQELTRNGVIEGFLPEVSKEIIETVKSLFAGQFSLSRDEEGNKAVEMALTNPERYLMKPQREGGGHNIFGKDIPDFLKNLPESERPAYVLMERIRPPASPNYVVRRGKPLQSVAVVGELGIFGVVLGDSKNILLNNEAGHLLRCKAQGLNEGGIGIGLGSLNLPYLL